MYKEYYFLILNFILKVEGRGLKLHARLDSVTCWFLVVKCCPVLSCFAKSTDTSFKERERGRRRYREKGKGSWSGSRVRGEEGRDRDGERHRRGGGGRKIQSFAIFL